ncbi:MAG: hypothetical protein HY288_05250 [Planctomycetia bacterium]|nr:hypothetical protein [Planctomycetia bacterium]
MPSRTNVTVRAPHTFVVVLSSVLVDIDHNRGVASPRDDLSGGLLATDTLQSRHVRIQT